MKQGIFNTILTIALLALAAFLILNAPPRAGTIAVRPMQTVNAQNVDACEAIASSNSPVCKGHTIELYGDPDGMASYRWAGPDGWTSSLQNPTCSPRL